MDNPGEEAQKASGRSKPAPFACILVRTIALTYFLVLTLLFLAGLVFSQHIREVLDLYATPEGRSHGFLWLTTSGFVLFSGASAGLILSMMKRRGGFYLTGLIILAIMALDFYFFTFDWLRYLIHSGLIFILGIAHFSGRCYRRTSGIN
jgi:membrane-associated HD superfamily phosphohydrolase